MSTEYTSETENAELRRRAAWLLVMLVLVAALFIGIMVTFFNNSGGDGNKVATVTGPTALPGSTSATVHSTSTAPSSTAPSSRAGSSSPTKHRGPASCPSSEPCVVDGDIGNAVAAINDYRTSHGQQAVPGSVSNAAQQCALRNGNGCSGGWAETQLSSADGKAAVQKILQFGKLLDPQMKSIEVGWAYDPGGKQYFFAIIRND